MFQGIAWRSSVDLGQQVLQIVFTAILARVLTREDFGLVAMALLINRFVYAVTAVGFGTAIIQNQETTEAQVSAVFFVQVTIYFFVSLGCYAAAPLAAAFFEEPKLVPLVRVLAWVLFINIFAFPSVLLRKRLEFSGYSILEIGSMVVGNIVGITMAFKGFGVWALVLRILTQRVLFSAAIWPVAGWFPVWPSFVGVKKLFHFGLQMLGSRMCNYFSQNLAAIIIGKFIGVETLGSFNIAYNLAIVPAQKIESVFAAVLTPMFSRIQANVAEFRRKFFASAFSLGVFFVPTMLGLAAVAQNFVPIIYGEKWSEAGLFLTFLAVVGMFKGMEHLLRSVVIAKGWASVIFRITALEAASSLPLLFLGSYFFQTLGLIAAYLVGSSLSFVLMIRAAQRAVEDNVIFLRATLRSFGGASLMFLIVIVCSKLASSIQPMVTLFLQVLLGVITYAILRIVLLNKKEREVLRSWPLPNQLLATK